jgi:hypothetical protein
LHHANQLDALTRVAICYGVDRIAGGFGQRVELCFD